MSFTGVNRNAEDYLKSLSVYRSLPAGRRDRKTRPTSSISNSSYPSRGRIPISSFMTHAEDEDIKRAGAAQKTIENYSKTIREEGTREDIEELDKILTKEDKGFGFSSDLLGGSMDLLSIGNHTTAGAFNEYFTDKDKDVYDSLQQAGREFSNALPGYSNEEAGRITFADVIRTVGGRIWDKDNSLHPDNNAFTGRYVPAVGGFILDVVLDPINLIPVVGPIAKVASISSRVAPKATKALGGLYKSNLDWLNNSPVLNKIIDFKSRMFDIDGEVRNVQRAINRGSTRIKSNTTKRESVRSQEEKGSLSFLEGDGTQFADAVSEKRREAQAQLLGLGSDIAEKSRRIIANLSDEENLAVSTFLDNQEQMKAVIDRAKHADPEVGKTLEKNINIIRDEYSIFFSEASRLGVIDPWTQREFYNYGGLPNTAISKKVSDKAMGKILEGTDVPFRTVDDYAADRVGGSDVPSFGQGGMESAKPKVYDTVIDKVRAGYSVEYSTGKTFASRGYQNAKAVVNERLYRSVLSDPRVAQRWNSPKKISGKLEEEFKRDGYSVMNINVGPPSLYIEMGEGAVDSAPDVAKHLRAAVRDKKIDKGVSFSVDRKSGKIHLNLRDTKGGDNAREEIVRTARDVVTSLGDGMDNVKLGSSFEQISYVLPTEIKNSLENMHKIFKNTDEMGKIIKTVQRITGAWKAFATLSPGFHSRNAYSNVFQLWLAGVGKGKYARDQALGMHQLGATAFSLNRKEKILSKSKERIGSLGDDVAPSVDILEKQLGDIRIKGEDGKFLTDEDLLKEMRDEGVLNRGHFSMQEESMGRSMEDIHMSSAQIRKHKKDRGVKDKTNDVLRSPIYRTGDKEIDKITDTFAKTIDEVEKDVIGNIGFSTIEDSAILAKNRSIGEQIENQFRTMLYLDRRIKGESAKDSSAAVRKYLFDYSELSDFEKTWMKTFIPFYTWQRKNIPLMLQSMVEQPAQFSKVPKLMNAIEQMSPDLKDVVTPDYFDEINAIRLPFAGEKDDIFDPLFSDAEQSEGGRDSTERPMFLNPNLPFQDIGRIPLISKGGGLVSSLNPLVQIGSDWYGYDTFTGRDIPDLDAKRGLMGSVNAFFDIGISERTAAIINDALPTVGKLDRLARPLVDEKDPDWWKAGLQLLSEGAGIKIVPVDEQKQIIGKTYELRKNVRARINKINRRRELAGD
tara:strand:+ start:1391 stop:4954 length:3564 start_codon:yes stop_codon:yes gene_type:complete